MKRFRHDSSRALTLPSARNDRVILTALDEQMPGAPHLARSSSQIWDTTNHNRSFRSRQKSRCERRARGRPRRRWLQIISHAPATLNSSRFFQNLLAAARRFGHKTIELKLPRKNAFLSRFCSFWDRFLPFLEAFYDPSKNVSITK